MATAMANRFGCKFMQTISSIKYLTLSHTSHHSVLSLSKCNVQVPSILQQRPLWSGSVFGNNEKTTTLEQQTTVPQKPKQPANVFILYLQRVEKQIMKEMPGAKRTEIISRASKMWNELDPEKKAQLALERREVFEKYKRDKKEYLANITPEQIMEDEKMKLKKAAKRVKKLRRSLGVPSKPWSAFSCYASEKFGERTVEDVPTYFKLIHDRWKNLSEIEKEKYVKMSQDMKAKYMADMNKWEDEMISMGRFDVLRKSTLERLSMGDRRKVGKKSQSNQDVEEI